MFGAYLITGIITGAVANGYMKKKCVGGDSVDQAFLSAMAGLIWPFTVSVITIHVGGNTVQKYLEERQ